MPEFSCHIAETRQRIVSDFAREVEKDIVGYIEEIEARLTIMKTMLSNYIDDMEWARGQAVIRDISGLVSTISGNPGIDE